MTPGREPWNRRAGPGVPSSRAGELRPGESRAQQAIPGGRAVPEAVRRPSAGSPLRARRGAGTPRPATALTWSAPPSGVQGGPRKLSHPSESLGRVGNAPGNTRPPPLPPGRRSAARPLPPGAPPSSRGPPWICPFCPVFPKVSGAPPAACCSGHSSKRSRDLLGGLHPSSGWVDLLAGRGGWRQGSTLPGSTSLRSFP